MSAWLPRWQKGADAEGMHSDEERYTPVTAAELRRGIV